MRMLCYGDSNTYGYDPRGFFGDRYPEESRWVDILVQRTGWEIRYLDKLVDELAKGKPMEKIMR